MSTKDTGKIHEKCPPLVAELIRKAGSASKAALMLGQASSGGLSQIASGKSPLTDSMRARVEAALRGEQVQSTPKPSKPKKAGAAALNAPAEVVKPAVPAFVEWNGKNVAVEVQGKSGKKQKIKQCPIPLAQLLTMHGGVRLAASEAIGYVTATALTNVLNGEREFDVDMQRKVYRVLNGLPLRDAEDATANDTFNLGVAICLANLSSYERLEDLADVMQGALLMRRSIGGAGWLLIWRFPKRENTVTFKRLAMRDAKDIVCP